MIILQIFRFTMSDTDEDFQLDLFTCKKLPIFKLSKEVPSDNSSSGDDMIKIKPKPNKITKTVGKIIPSFPVKKINDPMGKSPSVSATSIRAGLFGGQLESSVGGKPAGPETGLLEGSLSVEPSGSVAASVEGQKHKSICKQHKETIRRQNKVAAVSKVSKNETKDKKKRPKLKVDKIIPSFRMEKNGALSVNELRYKPITNSKSPTTVASGGFHLESMNGHPTESLDFLPTQSVSQALLSVGPAGSIGEKPITRERQSVVTVEGHSEMEADIKLLHSLVSDLQKDYFNLQKDVQTIKHELKYQKSNNLSQDIRRDQSTQTDETLYSLTLSRPPPVSSSVSTPALSTSAIASSCSTLPSTPMTSNIRWCKEGEGSVEKFVCKASKHCQRTLMYK